MTVIECTKEFLTLQAEVLEGREDKRWENLSNMENSCLHTLKRDLTVGEYEGNDFDSHDIPKINLILESRFRDRS